ILVLAISPLEMGGVYIGRIAAGAAMLCAAYKGRTRLAAVLGIINAAVLITVSPMHAAAAIGMAAGALAAGAISQGERIPSCAMYVAAGFIGIIAQDTARNGLTFLMELCASGALFLLVPERLLAQGTPRDEGEARRAAATELAQRVNELAVSLGDIGSTIGEVFDKLPKKGENYDDICTEVANQVCATCNRRMFCWVDCYSDTMAALSELSPILSRGIAPTASELPEIMQRRCIAPDKLAAGLAREYESWRSRRELRYQGELMRTALTEQYGSIAAALESFGKKLWNEDAPDEKKAARIDTLFNNLGVNTLSCRVAVDRDGRMHATVKLPRITLRQEEMKVISAEIADICRRLFEPVQIKQATGYTMLEYYEKALFEPLFAVSAIAAKEGVSGDAVRNFCDSYGNAHAILCDGMGTGKAAAVDGLLAASLTSRLIRAGFAAREAARLVNVALALKSEEEAGAALDILSVNLYTGKASLFKAGGAGSFLVHNGKVKRLGDDSLPIGILGDVVSREDDFLISSGDTAVLVSDGVCADGDEWLCLQLELTCKDTLQEMCDKASAAAVRRSGARPDDITVLALRLV
ncbi:MAG: SpoIIE family protein phosphatase, partial [Oscillospiraceae bacterium]